MAELTITSVIGSKPWKSKHGKEYIGYDVEVRGEDGQLTRGQLSQNPDTKPPEVGTSFDGEVIPSDYGMKIKKIAPAGGFKSNGNGGGGYTPKVQAEIRRQAAQKCAVWLLQAEVQAGLKFDHEPASALLKPRIDFFDRDAQEAGDKA